MTRSRVTVASLNTWGMAVVGSRLRDRYRAIGHAFEDSDVDVVGVQEVLTYWHLRQLTRHMPSFGYVRYRRSVVGPAGGVVLLSRLPVRAHRYRRFPVPARTAGLPGVPGVLRIKASLKGVLVADLAEPGLSVLVTHPLANPDGDWTRSNRFYPVQRGQLAAVAEVLRSVRGPAVVCGDFNVARDSGLFQDFIGGSGLVDTFDGRCPPTFRAEYLEPGRKPHCIDFILATGSVRTVRTEVIFAETSALPTGPAYVSDHVGLMATVAVPAPGS
jgi:endonuclease/exonuclease/phosphatase family metal-dependent hydrolase